MPPIDIVVETNVSASIRARQVSSMFDVPPSEKCRLEWKIEFPFDEQPWNIGLIVGPSGSGKTTVMKHLWGDPKKISWGNESVIDDFDKKLSVSEISEACSSVGFNTIPAWVRPYNVLSNGEKFRVDLARRLLELESLIVVDEFSSVVDRQVAKISSHAVQKFIRKKDKKFVAVGCHYDVIDWLQPDWVLDMATRQFTRRLLRRRPEIECVIGRVSRSAWPMFSKFHYMSADIHPSAQCCGLWANGNLAAFMGIIPCPISRGREKGKSIRMVSRLVTLPDWQGIGLAMVLCDKIAAEYKAAGKRLRTYPAHPSLVRSFNRSPNWKLIKKPGLFSKKGSSLDFGGRPCAVFEFKGPPSEFPKIFAENRPENTARASL